MSEKDTDVIDQWSVTSVSFSILPPQIHVYRLCHTYNAEARELPHSNGTLLAQEAGEKGSDFLTAYWDKQYGYLQRRYIMETIFFMFMFLLFAIVLYQFIKNIARRNQIACILSDMEGKITEMETIWDFVSENGYSKQQIDRLNEISGEFGDLNDQCSLLLEDEIAYVNRFGRGAGSFAAYKYHRDSRQRTEIVTRYNQIRRSVSSAIRKRLNE